MDRYTYPDLVGNVLPPGTRVRLECLCGTCDRRGFRENSWIIMSYDDEVSQYKIGRQTEEWPDPEKEWNSGDIKSNAWGPSKMTIQYTIRDVLEPVGHWNDATLNQFEEVP